MFSRKRSSAAAAAAAAAAATPDSFIGLISRATSEMLLETDWALVMQVCDAAAAVSDPAEATEGVRLVRKQIQSGQHRVVMHGLVLLESLVKNCSENFRFLSHVANDKLMKSMVRLVQRGQKKGGRDNLEAMEKVLDLVQAWGETYVQHQEKGVRLFVTYYHELRVKGVVFPRPFDQSTAIFTPKSRAGSTTAGRGAVQLSPAAAAMGGATAGSSGGASSAALSDEHCVVASTVDLLQQSLTHVESRESMLANDIIGDLMVQLNAVLPKMMRDIEAALLTSPPPPNLGAMMHLNEQIHVVMQKHQTILETGAVASAARESGPSSAGAAGISPEAALALGAEPATTLSSELSGGVADASTALLEVLGGEDGNVESGAGTPTACTPIVPKLVQPTSGRRRSRGRSGSGSALSPSIEPTSSPSSGLLGRWFVCSTWFFLLRFYFMSSFFERQCSTSPGVYYKLTRRPTPTHKHTHYTQMMIFSDWL